MVLSDISKIRLLSQQIAATKFSTPKSLVGWMGAIQAQDYAMAKWAVGIRLPGSTDKSVESAMDRGEIIRTHLLRPTWHLVSAEDIYWMLQLTAPHIITSLRSRHKDLELSESLLRKTNRLIKESLTGGNYLTREEIISRLHKAKINTENNRASHIMMRAELEGIICSGPAKGNKQTYALLNERVAETNILAREKALGKLAEKYFTSHCPATLQDFVWWSGLPVKDARSALEMVKFKFIPEIVGRDTYWVSPSISVPDTDAIIVKFLPAYDEFLISYKDRSASLPLKNNKKTVSENGIFRPVVVINGKVTGLWKRTVNKDKVIIETDFFQPHNKPIRNLIEKQAAAYGQFIDQIPELRFNPI